MNPETVGHLVTAAHASRIPAIVRVGVSFRYVVQQALESGADAVMAPMVESAWRWMQANPRGYDDR